MSVDLFTSGLLQGLVLALVAYAVMIPFRLLNFADLTSEGAYPLGGAICSSLIIAGIYPVFAILIACFLAGIMGICTALVHLKLKVNTLLAGIIISTMAYSVNLRFLGKPNVALFNNASLFSASGATIENIIILACIIATIIFMMFLFFASYTTSTPITPPVAKAASSISF
jgi:putative ABC transport system permease protein